MLETAVSCLSLAVRHMDLTVTYAMWADLREYFGENVWRGYSGVLGTSLGGWALLRQRLNVSAFAGIALLVCGMVLLHTS